MHLGDIGDVGFALIAFWVASASVRSRGWLMSPKTLPFLVYLGVGEGSDNRF